MIRALWLSSILFSAAGFAQGEAPAPVEPAPVEPAPVEPAPPPKPVVVIQKLLVIDLVDDGAGPELTRALTDAIAGQALRSHAGQVVTSQQLRLALDAAAVQALVGCADQTCLTDVGADVNAQKVLGGSVGKEDDKLKISLILVESETRKVLREETRLVPAVEDLYFYAAQQMTSLALTGVTTETRVPVRIDASEKAAEVTIDGKPAGKTPLDVQLDPGDHQITVKAPDRDLFSTLITLEPGVPALVDAQLIISRGSLWPLAIGLSAAGVLTLAGGLWAGALAQGGYDGNYYLSQDTSGNSFVDISPTDTVALRSKRIEIQTQAWIFNVLAPVGAALTVSGIALGTTELFVGE